MFPQGTLSEGFVFQILFFVFSFFMYDQMCAVFFFS